MWIHFQSVYGASLRHRMRFGVHVVLTKPSESGYSGFHSPERCLYALMAECKQTSVARQIKMLQAYVVFGSSYRRQEDD